MRADLPIKEFLAAGGVENWRVISGGACAFYPSCWTLADQFSNEADIATVGGRG